MDIDRSKVYDSVWDFFRPSGHAIMKLTPSAAIRVCNDAAARQLVVVGVEGGIHSEGRFEARLDCIWDGRGAPIDQVAASRNNLEAAEFVKYKSNAHNAFIITV